MGRWAVLGEWVGLIQAHFTKKKAGVCKRRFAFPRSRSISPYITFVLLVCIAIATLQKWNMTQHMKYARHDCRGMLQYKSWKINNRCTIEPLSLALCSDPCGYYLLEIFFNHGTESSSALLEKSKVVTATNRRAVAKKRLSGTCPSTESLIRSWYLSDPKRVHWDGVGSFCMPLCVA